MTATEAADMVATSRLVAALEHAWTTIRRTIPTSPSRDGGRFQQRAPQPTAESRSLRRRCGLPRRGAVSGTACGRPDTHHQTKDKHGHGPAHRRHLPSSGRPARSTSKPALQELHLSCLGTS